jgi:TIR domain
MGDSATQFYSMRGGQSSLFRRPDSAMASEYDVFLSHHGDDKPEVELLANRLQSEAGIRPFLDKWHLVAGKSVATRTRACH